MKPTKRQIQIVEHFIKKETKRLMKETSAYERAPEQIKTSMSGYIGNDFAKVASNDDIVEMTHFKDDYAKVKNQLRSIIDRINNLRKKYKLSPDQNVK